MQIKSIGIIGHGDFGKFLYTLAKKYYPDIPVKVASRSNAPDGEKFFPLQEVCAADVLIVTVPISAFADVVSHIAPLLGKETIVVDVATIKQHTVDVLRKSRIPRFIATHPMFGPYSYEKHDQSLKGLRVAVCESTLAIDELTKIKEWLRTCGLTVLELTPLEHDRLIAETLFLTHFVGQTVTQGGFARTAIDTVSFGFLMDAVESVSRDGQLFREVFMYNPYCKETLARFQKAQEEVVLSLNREERV